MQDSINPRIVTEARGVGRNIEGEVTDRKGFSKQNKSLSADNERK
jgi:hypothetical protein